MVDASTRGLAFTALALYLSLTACGGSGAGPDGGVEPDVAANQACDAEQLATWQSNRLSTGLGSPTSRAAYEQVIGQLMSDYALPGGAIAVARNGKLVLALGLGWGDTTAHTPAHPDDLFRIASLSKQITAAAVLRLVEQSQVALDDTVFSILTGYAPIPGQTTNPALASITVRHLLQHRGGWNRDFEAVRDPMFRSTTIANAFVSAPPASVDLVIRYMLDKPVTYAPGSTYCYSNFGYALLGRVIERRTGAGYETWVKDNILTPAGATRMRMGKSLLVDRMPGEVRYDDYPGAPLATSAFPGQTPGTVPWPYGGFHMEAMDAHGAWLSSPIDMVRFQLRIDGQPTPADSLTPTSRTAMLANPNVPNCTAAGGTTPATSGYWYGMGLQVNSGGNTWHTGSLPGTSAESVSAVRNAQHFSWVAMFNSRPQSDAFWARLDQDLWTALTNTGPWWSGEDYFAQYSGDYTDWVDATALDSEIVAQRGMNRFPVRLEGRPGDPATFRALFVPVPAGTSPAARAGLSCLEFRAEHDTRVAAGRRVINLQLFDDPAGFRRYQAVWDG